MNKNNHINLNAFDKAKDNLIALYKEQIPSSIFMFLIGISTSLTMSLFKDSDGGKSAATFLNSLVSGLSQFKIFLAVAIVLLLISSLSKLNQYQIHEESHLNKSGWLADISIKGFFSFLIPISSLIFSMGLVMLVCMKINPALAISQEINNDKLGLMFFSSLSILIFSMLFYGASLLERIAKSSYATTCVTFTYFVLLLIALFDISK